MILITQIILIIINNYDNNNNCTPTNDSTFDIIANFFKYLNNLFPNFNITNFKSDQGKEYCSRKVNKFYKKKKKRLVFKKTLFSSKKILKIMVLPNVSIKPFYIHLKKSVY